MIQLACHFGQPDSPCTDAHIASRYPSKNKSFVGTGDVTLSHLATRAPSCVASVADQLPFPSLLTLSRTWPANECTRQGIPTADFGRRDRSGWLSAPIDVQNSWFVLLLSAAASIRLAKGKGKNCNGLCFVLYALPHSFDILFFLFISYLFLDVLQRKISTPYAIKTIQQN